MKDYSRAAVEILEIINYMDKDLVKQIPKNKMEYLNKIKDSTYKYEIDKSIPLYDNIFLPETDELLLELFKDIV